MFHNVVMAQLLPCRLSYCAEPMIQHCWGNAHGICTVSNTPRQTLPRQRFSLQWSRPTLTSGNNCPTVEISCTGLCDPVDCFTLCTGLSCWLPAVNVTSSDVAVGKVLGGSSGSRLLCCRHNSLGCAQCKAVELSHMNALHVVFL